MSEIKLLPMATIGIFTFVIVTLGLWIGASAIEDKPAPPAAKVAVVAPDNPLDRARMASFDIILNDYYTSGSAVNISRVKADNGEFTYRAITAYHVVDEMERGLIDDPVSASRNMTMTFQMGFHDQPLVIDLDILEFSWYIPYQDWATFTYRTHHRLECADVATEENFKAIKPFDPIYTMAGYGPYGQQCRQGIIATTHNIAAHRPDQQRQSYGAWNKQPDVFFRISMPVWYGDSGGGVFDQWGRLIGIVNAFTVRGGPFGQLVPHSGVCFKAHVMRDITQYSRDFLKVED